MKQPQFGNRAVRPWLLVLVASMSALATAPAAAGSDDEESAKAGIAPPADWLFPAPLPLRVLESRGRWYPEYAIDRALARLGDASITASWHHPASLRFYPETYEELMSHHLVIVGNINAKAFGPVRRAMLKQFAAAGGGVLFLGGRLAFGGGYRGTALEEITPVTFAAKDDVTAAPLGGLVLAPGPDTLGKGFAHLAWRQQPRVFWYHDELKLNPGASVLLTAGGKPLLIAGSFGKGRVAMFAGTVLGDSQPGELPFWNWNDWPNVMAATIDWLTVPSRATAASRTGEAPTAAKPRLPGLDGERAAKAGPALARAAIACRGRDTARGLLDTTMSLEGQVPLELVERVGDAARPYVDSSFAPQAEALLAGPQSNKVSLGLCVLGQSRSRGAREKLEAALANPEAVVPRGLLDASRADTVAEDAQDAHFAVRLGALEGLGNLGAAAALPVLHAAIERYGHTRSDPAKFPHDVTQEDELYQEAILSALRCGDAAQATSAIDLLLENHYVFIRMVSILDAPQYQGPEHKAEHFQRARVAQELPRIRARLQRLLHKLSGLPENVLVPLAVRLAAEDDPRAVPIAMAIFGKGAAGSAGLSPPIRAALVKALLPAIADLAHMDPVATKPGQIFDKLCAAWSVRAGVQLLTVSVQS